MHGGTPIVAASVDGRNRLRVPVQHSVRCCWATGLILSSTCPKSQNTLNAINALWETVLTVDQSFHFKIKIEPFLLPRARNLCSPVSTAVRKCSLSRGVPRRDRTPWRKPAVRRLRRCSVRRRGAQPAGRPRGVWGASTPRAIPVVAAAGAAAHVPWRGHGTRIRTLLYPRAWNADRSVSSGAAR